ncbi:UNVERIFIED_CONTAM: hypothetical protein Sradi_0148600 [Sesamum radiatum]|uniref:GAG-pre-integrase domain-containing protein n=1 Tax=Sesamum radiatum TaxID=300843 RepID=A0AAW2WNK9_SESRA
MIGKAKMGYNIPLKDVLCLPDFNCNLASVSKLTKQLNCSIVFLPTGCILQDLTTKRVIGTGKLKGDLYYFESQDEAKIHVAKTYMKMEILHQRIGHIPNKRLRSIFGDTIFDDNRESRPCDACHKAKQCQNIYLVRDNISKNVFDLVHLDTWGPYSNKTHDGYYRR